MIPAKEGSEGKLAGNLVVEGDYFSENVSVMRVSCPYPVKNTCSCIVGRDRKAGQ